MPRSVSAAASRAACSRATVVSPRASWMTITPGQGPSPTAGRARYAFIAMPWAPGMETSGTSIPYTARLSTASVDQAVVALPLAGPQHELLDLAGAGLGQIAEFDRLGRLEARQVQLAELDQLRLRGLPARLQGHKR